MVPTDYAFPHRTHEENRPFPTSTPRTHPQLTSGRESSFPAASWAGLNNKAKITMRKSYGFRTYRVLELALYHSLGKLPEPESTHDFF
jgi:transposase